MDAGAEQARRVEEEAASWCIPDLISLPVASPEDLPVLDLAPLRQGRPGAMGHLATKLRKVFATTGFFLLANHGCEEEAAATLAASRRFHTQLSQEAKDKLVFGPRGVGYLQLNMRVLPRREKGNLNEAFIIKQEHGPRNITLESNPFPPEEALPGFRDQVLHYAARMEALALSLLPVFASALDLPHDYFSPAFTSPLFRLRLSCYPPSSPTTDQFGIAPHTDTSFFTLLAQDGHEGLVVRRPCGRWTRIPADPSVLVVNTGELLRQWSNDTVPSTPHFVVNMADQPR